MFSKRLFLSLFVIIAATFVNAQKTIQLFNGKNLKGWYAFQPETGKKCNASKIFKVEDNMIRFYGKKSGYLMSKKSFKNFQLTVEFRWNTNPDLPRRIQVKNSGVMYLVPKKTKDMLWPKGIQFQIKEGSTGDFIFLQGVTLDMNGKRTEAGKSVVVKRIATKENPEKPAGEWNTLVVTVDNGKITQTLNGVLVNEGTEPSVSKGRILLQYEGYPIDFRKVEIKKLKK